MYHIKSMYKYKNIMCLIYYSEERDFVLSNKFPALNIELSQRVMMYPLVKLNQVVLIKLKLKNI